MPADGQPLGRLGRLAQQHHLALQLGHRVLAEPLEGRVRLGHEATHRGGDGDGLGVPATDLHAAAPQFGDAQHVLVALGRQADQEVQLHPPPTLAEGGVDGPVQILFGDELVDHLPHAPGTTLGCKGQPGPTNLLDLRRRGHREGIHPEAGQADRHPAAIDRVVDDLAHRVLNAREVGRRQRGQRHLVVAAPLQALADHFLDLLGRALAHRAGDHAGLAETTAAGTAPEDLDVQAVMHHFGQRHQRMRRVRPVGQVQHRPLGHLGRHAGRHRDTSPPVDPDSS